MKYRNYRELTQREIDKLKELYPVTTNRELCKIFGISVDAIQDRFAYPNGWKKERFKLGNRGGKPLDEKSINWIIKHYRHTRNADILEKFGIGESTLHRIARKHSLTKSRQYMNKSARANNDVAMKVCRRYKIYERNAEATRKQWEQWRVEGRQMGFKPGETNLQRFGKKRYQAMLEKMSVNRKELIRKERMRVNWGLPQQTKIKVYGAGRGAAMYRHLLKRLNYIVERGSTTVYYDELTSRSLKKEQTAIKHGLRILEAI